MIRLSILAGAAAVASLLAGSAAAKPAAPNDQARAQADAAQRDASASPRPGYSAHMDPADKQRQLWFKGLAAYEARYGSGSYDAYARTHPEVSTVIVTPAGKVEGRGSTTVLEAPEPPVYDTGR
jgi:hypothetical protein